MNFWKNIVFILNFDIVDKGNQNETFRCLVSHPLTFFSLCKKDELALVANLAKNKFRNNKIY